MDFFPIPFLTSNVVSGVLKSAFRKFDISDDDLILIDTALDDSVDGRDFHHFQAEIAELVRSNKCSVRPAERHPRDTRLRLQLRQKNELSFVRFTRLEDVLKK
jgi:hypothetical protein